MDVSSGAVIFFRDKDEIRYLLLKHKDYWGFAKGLVEKSESLKETALREIKEETGLDVNILPFFRESVEFFYRWEGRLIKKRVYYFLAEADTKDVKLSNEHYGYRWLAFDEACELARIKSQKDLLAKAKRYLEKFKGF